VLVPRVQEITRSDGTVVRRKPREGDMRWDGKVWLRWNGRRWLTAAYSPHPERLRDPARLDSYPPISAATAQRMLDQAVEDQVADNAATVVFSGEQGVIIGFRRPVTHWAHAVMTALTGGLWAVVWIVCAVNRREDRVRLSVDDWGNVWVKLVAGI
jgi:hypothetical protein